MSTYRFTIVNGQVTTVSELHDGVWIADPLGADETAVYDAAAGTVVVTESKGTYNEVKTFTLVAGSSTDFAETSETYTDLSGNPIDLPPGQTEGEDNPDDSDGDGFDDDHVSGDDGSDDISGHGGDDDLDGAAGDDSINGGTGDDTVSGGDDDDSVDGGDDDDIVSGGSGNDDVHGGNGADDVLGGIGNDTVAGDAGDDRLYGGSGNDILAGGAGDDSIRGDGGNDRVRAGDDAGNDVYSGGTGTDVVDYSGADAGVAISLAAGTAASRGTDDLAHVGSDTFSGFENARGGSFADRISGSSGANTLAGGSGNDTIAGGAGDDVLVGGTGGDKLYGGSDSAHDVFAYTSVAESRGAATDDLYQFRSGTDDVDLRGIDANTALAGNQAFVWGGTKAVAHGVWVADTGADIRVFADVNGDKVADFSFDVMGVSSVVSSDFML